MFISFRMPISIILPTVQIRIRLPVNIEHAITYMLVKNVIKCFVFVFEAIVRQDVNIGIYNQYTARRQCNERQRVKSSIKQINVRLMYKV